MGIHRRKGVSFEPSGDSVVILDADATVLTTLNPTGALIWRSLDGRRDAEALARDLVSQFQGIDEAQLLEDIRQFIASLVEAELVDID